MKSILLLKKLWNIFILSIVAISSIMLIMFAIGGVGIFMLKGDFSDFSIFLNYVVFSTTLAFLSYEISRSDAKMKKLYDSTARDFSFSAVMMFILYMAVTYLLKISPDAIKTPGINYLIFLSAIYVFARFFIGLIRFVMPLTMFEKLTFEIEEKDRWMKKGRF